MWWSSLTRGSQVRRAACRVAILLSLGLVIVAPAWGDVPVARLTGWPILIAAKPAPAERHAADELRDLVAQATGTRMEIVTTDRPHESGLFLGKAAEPRRGDLGEEAFRIRIRDHRIDIAGDSPRGTLYGVYAFLEDELGVRFLTHDHTFVPHASPDKVFKVADRVIRPRFAWRWSYYGANSAHPEFAARLRNNAVTERAELGGRSSWSLISHSVNEYIPVARLGKDHPEYFSLVNGKRRGFMHDDQFEQGGTQPCFTNPDVKRLIKNGILDRLARSGQTGGDIAISQNDNTMYCRCDLCREIDDHEDSHMGALLTLVNEVGQAVAQKRPGVFVGTLAYQFSRTPPRSLKPGPNVAIQLCSIEACQIHPLNDPGCPKNLAFCKDLEGWCRICDNVYVWNYNTNFACYNSPCPNLGVIGPNVRFLAAHGVKGVFMQAAGNAQNTELCELRNDLISRLLWDPTLDDRKLIDEFVTLHYGRAADKVKAYLSLIGETARRSGVHQNCFGSAAGYGMNATIARKAIELLEEGMKAAENEEVRNRVEKVCIGPRTVLIEPFARWVRTHNHQIASTVGLKAPREAYTGIEGELRDVFRLYHRHHVDRFAEWVSTEQVQATLPESVFRAG
jgi:Domain of unknown function (DUF4838)/Glycosyl hydrolase family 20, domain 2